MICTARRSIYPIRISTSKTRYFHYNYYPNQPHFYEGDDLEIYRLPMIAPNVLTWWEEE